MRHHVSLLLVTSLAQVACTLSDARDRLTVAPAGELHGDMSVRLQVESTNSAGTFHIVVDDMLLPGAYPFSTWVDVDVSSLPLGGHLLRAVALGGPTPAQSDLVTLFIDRTPATVTFQTDPANMTSPEPFFVDLAFSAAVPPGGVDGITCSTIPIFRVPACQAIWSHDGRTVRLDFGRPLGRLTTAKILVKTTVITGAPVNEQAEFALPPVALKVDGPTLVSATNRLTFRVSTTTGLPGQVPLVVLLDGHRLPDVPGPPPWEIDLDLTSQADGPHALAVMLQGFGLDPGDWRPPPIVRPAPQFLNCGNAGTPRPEGVARLDPVDLGFSPQDLSYSSGTFFHGVRFQSPAGAFPIATAGPANYPVTWNGARVYPDLDTSTLELPLRAVISFDAPPSIPDEIPIEMPSWCNLTYPAFLRPFGDPVRFRDGLHAALAAESVTIPSSTEFDRDYTSEFSRLVWLEPAGTGYPALLTDGSMSRSQAITQPVFATGESWNGTSTDSPAEFRAAWWRQGVEPFVSSTFTIERDSNGIGLARSVRHSSDLPGPTSPWDALNADVTQDARHLAAWTPSEWRTCTAPHVTAWVEDRPASEPMLQFRSRWEGQASHALLPSIVPAIGVTLDAPAVTSCNAGDSSVMVAFLRRDPGGAANVAVASLAPGAAAWATIIATLNRDPAREASEVVVGSGAGFTVAWVEEGQVLLCHHPAALASLGSPEVMNLDPSCLARMPRIQELTGLGPGFRVAFVEACPAGDRIVVRRWDGARWLPPRVLETGLPSGSVVSLGDMGSRFGNLTWVDSGGLIHVATVNE